MATNTTSTTSSYTSSADMIDTWINSIAPNYFDFAQVNQYRSGTFGYINEVMGTVTEDSFNGITIARREFYPNTAEYTTSLYKMAAMQQMEIPMYTPATARAVIILPEKDIIEKGTYNNGIQEYVIDSTIKLMADEIPFMLNNSIVIVSKRVGTSWIHASHYSIDSTNTLSTSSNKYIVNKTVNGNGVNYLLLSVDLRQVDLEIISEVINKDANINVATVDVSFSGNIAYFDAFYKDGNTGNPVKLTLVAADSIYPTTGDAFAIYQIVNDNLIRLTFPNNPYFTPSFNSEVDVYIYTSLGLDGNFDTYNGSLVASINSEKYPYNNTLTVTGKINGASTGGLNKPTFEELRSLVVNKYSTNNTITTLNDLQIYFDNISLASDPYKRSKIVFRKKRDDALYRIYGAYSLMKDSSDNTVPTNTLLLNSLKSQLVPDGDLSYNSFSIKPGTIFEYSPDQSGVISYDMILSSGITISDDLEEIEKTKFLFTNPYLISAVLNPNIVGYYMNSINLIRSVEYTYVNDNTLYQFISSSFRIDRNALIGENFYRMYLTITPASEMSVSTLFSVNDPTLAENQIRATTNGYIKSIIYTANKLICTIQYDDGSSATIDANNSYEKTSDGVYAYSTGYDILFDVGEKFIVGDLLATKKITDLGKMRCAIDISGVLYSEGKYIPMLIDSYEEINGTPNITLVGYVATDDNLSPNALMLLTNGVYDSTGVLDDNVASPYKDLIMNINLFYKDDAVNYPHAYSSFDYFNGYTMVNTYSQNSNDKSQLIYLIKQIDYVRSSMKFSAGGTDPNDFAISISDIPVCRASWAKETANYTYVVNKIVEDYSVLEETYFLLENNFGIAMSFFNTYGKSRFFSVGIMSTTTVLNSVNTSWRFGVFLTSLNSPDLFLSKFTTYVKNYIESVNYIGNTGQSIYVMNMISDIKSEFSEIGYIEYYGFNDYDYSYQKIESMSEDAINVLPYNSYIPEFINIASVTKADGSSTPDISVLFLEN